MNAPTNRPFGPQVSVVPEQESWGAEYPFTSQFLNLNAASQDSETAADTPPLWMHYIDEGPRDAPVLLFLHGNPTWSFIWRHAISALKGRFRCVAMDHVGMGLSDRPYPWSYSLDAHASNVERLLDHLQIDSFVVVAHDWGGMIGMTAATRRPEAYRGAVVMNTAAFLGKLPPSISAVRIPLFGKIAVLGFNAFARAAISWCISHDEKRTPALKSAYLAPYQTPRDRIATLRFVEDVPQKSGHATWDLVSQTDERLGVFRERPLLVLWGEKDWCFTPSFREGWLQRFPNAEVEIFPDANHYVFEDAAERVVKAMSRFVNGHFTQPTETQSRREAAS